MKYNDALDLMETERKRQYLTRQELADLSGISESTFIKWTRRESKPQLEPFLMVMEALGLEMKFVRRDKRDGRGEDPDRRNTWRD